MAKFSKRSKENLATADDRLQRLFNAVIEKVDCTVIYGHRDPDTQFELFKKGRELRDGEWIKTGATVTNLDGKIKLSYHNYSPALAVDVVPYPIDWEDISRFKSFAQIVKSTAKELGIEVEWGGDWKSFKDYPHWQVKSTVVS